LHKIDSPDSRSRRLSPKRRGDGREGKENDRKKKGRQEGEKRKKKGFRVNTPGSSGPMGEKKEREGEEGEGSVARFIRMAATRRGEQSPAYRAIQRPPDR